MDASGKEPARDDIHGLHDDERRQRDRRDPGGRPAGGGRERPARRGARPGGDAVLPRGGRPGGRPGRDRLRERDVPRDRYEAPRSRADRPLWHRDERDTPPGQRGPRAGGRPAPRGDYAQPQRDPSAPSRPQRDAWRAGEPARQPRRPRPPAVRFQPAAPAATRGAPRDRPAGQRFDPGRPSREDRYPAAARGYRDRRDGPARREVRRFGPRRDDGAEQGALRRYPRGGEPPDPRLPGHAGGEHPAEPAPPPPPARP